MKVNMPVFQAGKGGEDHTAAELISQLVLVENSLFLVDYNH